MFQFLLALTFMGMVFAPAFVASMNGKKEFDPESDDMMSAPQMARVAQPARSFHAVSTLPLHDTLGMAGR